MNNTICRYDISGKQLKDGDIVAQCEVGREIWDNKAVIVSRPLGIIKVSKDPHTGIHYAEEDCCYKVVHLREGKVKLTDKADDWMKHNLADKDGYGPLYLSLYDGDFFGWNDIEVIGNIYEDYPY